MSGDSAFVLNGGRILNNNQQVNQQVKKITHAINMFEKEFEKLSQINMFIDFIACYCASKCSCTIQGIYHVYIVHEEGWLRDNNVYEYEKNHVHAGQQVPWGIGDEC